MPSRAGSVGRKRCTKGKSCGRSCIARAKICRIEAGANLSESLSSLRGDVASRQPPKRKIPKVDNRSVTEKMKEALPDFEVTKTPAGHLKMEQIIDGQKLVVAMSPKGSIIFVVNGSISFDPNIPKETRAKIGFQVKKAAEALFSSVPNGTLFEVTAATGDGKGEKRAKAYVRIGFSKPNGNIAGAEQTGVVKDGKLTPIVPTAEVIDRVFNQSIAF